MRCNLHGTACLPWRRVAGGSPCTARLFAKLNARLDSVISTIVVHALARMEAASRLH